LNLLPAARVATPLPASAQFGAWTRWGDALHGLRNRLLANPRFHRWASGFWLTRPIAHRRAGALFDIVAGFVYAQVLQACVQLKLFELLAEGPQTVAQLAPRLGLAEPAALRLLNAAAALQLAQRRSHERFGLGMLGATLVGNAAVLAMVEHHAALYADLRDPVALLRGETGPTALGDYWPYAGAAGASASAQLPGAGVARYTALMAASQPLVASEILDSYAFAQHRHVLDIGGGNGSFLAQVAHRHPGLALTLFDLPAVAAQASTHLASLGLARRVTVAGGSFLETPLPGGADLVTLVRVVHDHDDPAVLALLQAVHRVLPPGGTLLIAEPMSHTPGAEAMGDAYFGFYLLAMGQGRPRSAEALSALLLQAGFQAPRLLANRMPLQTRILVATKGVATP
jgi:demethylspheroidene O-methyltransferase